jgi:phosphohistidine phosphatase
MRRLLLFRHAKAERPNEGKQDRMRDLTQRGRRNATSIGSYMASHALIPDCAIISPAKRAQETWKHAATAFSPPPSTMTQERLYDTSPHIIFSAIKDTPANVHLLLVIGHNPSLQELALMLIASGEIDARERLHEKLPTSGLVIVDFAFDDWQKLREQSGRLERFVSPKLLTASNFDD